jgi:outer membrane protein OmpA-like peptidoglycan-associated protein
VALEAELAPFAQIPTYKGTVSIDKLSLADFESLAKPALANLAGLVSLQGDFEVEQKEDAIHVLNEGELKVEEIGIKQEQVLLTNQSLAWDGATELTFNTVSAQTHVRSEGKLTVKDTSVQHQRALLTNQSLGWDGATDLTLGTASSQASVKSEGKLTSTGLATDLHRQKLKFEYQNLDLDVVFSYAEDESGADIALNSDLLVSGLDLFAPEKKVDIVRVKQLQLAGLEIKGPEHVSAEKITAEGLDLGRSLEQQETAPEDENLAIFHAGKVLISKFSHIDGFTTVDTIMEDQVQVVYHRDKEGTWNAVTLLDTLAGGEKDAGETQDGEARKDTSDETDTEHREEAAAGPPPIAVNRVDVSKGSTATIHDESVSPAFKTTLTINELFLENLDGRNPEQTTTFKLDGQLDKHSSVNAGGDIKPYLQPAEMDIQGKLQAIGLPPLSPYTTDSMGIIIDSGSLDADLKLVSQDKLMNGEAVLLMHQLSVKGTDSKDGLQSKIPVPLDMALNILRDKNDTIELKIPIEGDAENPDLDVSNAITKAVAAGVSAGATSYLVYALQPYGAMIAVAKVAGEAASKVRLEPVEFEPGQASLDDTDRDYLSKIAKVLKERPKLAVKVCGIAVQQDVAHLQPPADKTSGQSGKKETPPAAPVVDEQKLTDLGRQRAASVKDYLVDKFKIPANHLANCQPRLETDQADALPRTDLLL